MSQKLIIDAKKTGFSLGISDLIAYRDLFVVMAYRDFRVRYAQTYMGFLWAFIQPAITLCVFLFVFGKNTQSQIGNIPYLLFAATGLAAWSYFSFVVNQSGAAMITSQEMIKKIYFPRLVIPLSKALVGLIDFGVVLLLVIAIMFYYDYTPSIKIVWLPAWLLLILLSALGGGIGLSALSIRYRDFQHVSGFLVQLGMFLTPIAYPSTNIPEKYQIIYFLNPMAGIAEGFRWSLLNNYALPAYAWVSVVSTVLFFGVAIVFFKKIEYKIADLL